MYICFFFFPIYHPSSLTIDDSPSAGVRSAVGRVGLRNLGNTCYINSCLQQLFMIEPLRNGLLSLGEGDTDPGRCVFGVSCLSSPTSPIRVFAFYFFPRALFFLAVF